MLLHGSFDDMRFSKISTIGYYDYEYANCQNIEFLNSVSGIIYSRVYQDDYGFDSKFSFNTGRNWTSLGYLPLYFRDQCIRQECILFVSDTCKFKGESRFLTDKNSPNLILTLGFLMVGQQYIDGFLISEDFGRTWYLGKTNVRHFTLLDQGGIIVAVENNGVLHYSFDHGITWTTQQIQQNIEVLEIFPFEDQELKQAIILAQTRTDRSWIIIIVDLSTIFDRNCSKNDYDVLLSPIGSHSCIRGMKTIAYKRKREILCFNKMDELLHQSDANCICTEDDLKCGYGFVMGKSDCEVDTDYKKSRKKTCKYGEYHSSKIILFRQPLPR
ncbi:Vacuolar protein sorting/targeting protein 10 [Thelohanellus kitauei]|uniref:Vacuolar protein sorting/targeting protein 10 n=1 Tax=Thelohanellus kitauei TaxID=669202 RepID=A0A0C2MXA4_THEKT|nr:Vacuolar protein sorting/targeting protein 10 [Thelohanellus kitauei]